MKYISTTFFCIALIMTVSCESPQFLTCDSIHEIRNTDRNPISLRSEYKALTGMRALNSTFVNLNNEPLQLYDKKGDVVVLNFWFIQCRPCIAEMPSLFELKESYQNQNVSFISVAKNDKEELNAYINDHEFNWNLYLADDVRHEFCVGSYPTTIILDKQMNVLHFGTGSSFDENQIARHMDRLRGIIDSAL